jgi:ribosomal protein RSM22 (predicted rRNA methylase)
MSRRRNGLTLSVSPQVLEAIGEVDVAQCAQSVEKLSVGLTRKRRMAGKRYLADPRLRAAYATYYLCANAPKVVPLLDELAHLLPDDHIRVLELGCGPGTGVAGVASWAAERDISVTHRVTDLLPANVKAAIALGEKLAESQPLTMDGAVVDVRKGVPSQLPDKDPVDLLLIMNLVNELPDVTNHRIVNAAEKLAANGVVLVIEPAAQAASRRALELRDVFCAAGWSVRLPCTHDGACPALAADDDWCHGEWRFDRPQFMVDVDTRIGNRREVLKATYFAVTKAPAPRADTLYRIVSERQDSKAISNAFACGADGRVKYELQKRDRTDANRAFSKVSRYSRVHLEGGTAVGGARRLGPEDRCEVADDEI